MLDFTKGILDKYADVHRRYTELSDYLISPEIIADNRLYLKYAEEKASLEKAYLLGEGLKLAIELGDDDEINSLSVNLATELMPKGENDERGAVIELRAENPQSKPLMQELINMYSSYAKSLGYDLSVAENEDKFTSLIIENKGAYFRFKSELGTHRSTGGTIGNCNVSVTVMPTSDAIKLDIKDGDIRTDIFHSSGAGGQNINKVATAVRLTHLPTGIVVVCKEERSQLQNRNRATAVLNSKLYAHYQENLSASRLKEKREKLFSARNARVRFYDFTSLTATDLRTDVTIPLKEAYGKGLNTLINSVLIKER